MLAHSFNGHPPLGVNATYRIRLKRCPFNPEFQWAPTLGGECYRCPTLTAHLIRFRFNGHPPLGVNATDLEIGDEDTGDPFVSMGTHPWG